MKGLPMVLLVALAGLPAPGESQEPFVWNRAMSEGSTVSVHSVNGPIEVIAAPGRELRVRGEVLDERGDREPVRFEVVESGDDVTICVITDRHVCEEDGIREVERRARRSRGSESAELRVELPVGVHLVAGSGNGRIDVTDAGADVDAWSGNGEIAVRGAAGRVTARTGNGTIDVAAAGGPVEARSGNGEIAVHTASGPVEVETGNGDIDVVMEALGSGDLEFATGNGDVRVEMPEGLNADMEVRLGNGSIDSDFPLQVSGRFNARRFQTTIGSGGRALVIRSGNGDAILRRR